MWVVCQAGLQLRCGWATVTGAMSGATHDVAVHRLMSKHCNYTAALNATATPHRQHPEHRCGSLLHVTRSVVRARHTDERMMNRSSRVQTRAVIVISRFCYQLNVLCCCYGTHSNPSHRSIVFLLRDWLHGFPRTVYRYFWTFCFYLFFSPLFSCWFRAVD